MSSEIRPGSSIVAPAGGAVLDYVSPDGEVVGHFAVPAGRHSASQWLNLVEPGYSLEVGKDAVCFQRRAGVSLTAHPEALASDANPDFRPTSASRLEREMRAEIASMKGLRKKIEARERALASVELVEQIPDARPKPEDNPKVEPKPEDDQKP